MQYYLNTIRFIFLCENYKVNLGKFYITCINRYYYNDVFMDVRSQYFYRELCKHKCNKYKYTSEQFHASIMVL